MLAATCQLRMLDTQSLAAVGDAHKCGGQRRDVRLALGSTPPLEARAPCKVSLEVFALLPLVPLSA